MDNNAVNPLSSDSVLLCACKLNQLDVVKNLVRFKADINQPNRDGLTPLSYALLTCNKPLIAILSAAAHTQN